MESKGIIIAAVADNGVIGYENKMPWRKIPEDLKRFRELTLGHAVLMGRKTYNSLGNNPLAGRLNVVLTRENHPPHVRKDLVFSDSLDEAIKSCENYRQDRIFYIIGGAEVYRQTIDLVGKMEITHVHQSPEGDSFFPEFDMVDWRKVCSQRRRGYEFATYERR